MGKGHRQHFVQEDENNFSMGDNHLCKQVSSAKHAGINPNSLTIVGQAQVQGCAVESRISEVASWTSRAIEASRQVVTSRERGTRAGISTALINVITATLAIASKATLSNKEDQRVKQGSLQKARKSAYIGQGPQ
jgi:hypothetical protein